jgi:YD repeat-containing protein
MISGKDLTTLKTREAIHDQFGEPSATGFAEGKPFEEFRTRWKISEQKTAKCMTYGMGLAMTFGMGEPFYFFPHELYLLGKRTLLGQTIRVTYDGSGNVAGILLDGEQIDMFFGFERATVGSSDEVAPLLTVPPLGLAPEQTTHPRP